MATLNVRDKILFEFLEAVDDVAWCLHFFENYKEGQEALDRLRKAKSDFDQEILEVLKQKEVN